ncbi:MAG: hypothetical protein EXR51_03800 [Dehalococcoidia bacterium]|nr:hypothetical protein [Dehalococcoidia bacterium]
MRSAFRLLALASIMAASVMPLAATAQGTPPGPQAPPRTDSTFAALGLNLIVNGDAETGATATNAVDVQRPSGWVVSGSLTQVQYGSAGGLPTALDAGPVSRGRGLFAPAGQPASTPREPRL